MSYLDFEKEELVNLEFSLNGEFLKSNAKNTYACSTLPFCNTRKYHGLLTAPQPNIDNEKHLFLSSLDETIIQDNSEFNLAVHKYLGEIYSPNGHKYLEEFSNDPILKHIYQIGNISLSKEIIIPEGENRIILKYKVLGTSSAITLRIRPMLAFRQIHKLGRANEMVNIEYQAIENGIKVCMYDQYAPLFIQSSINNNYTHNPDWYYNFEYQEEKERGYDFLEDLYTPGYFDFNLNLNDEVYISAGLNETETSKIGTTFCSELKKLLPIQTMEDCLRSAARSFIIQDKEYTNVLAGFPWFGCWGRDTFISLPGLTLATNNPKTCKAVIDTLISELNGGLFPNIGSGNSAAYNSVDAPLWFFWALQQYAKFTKTENSIWKEYGDKMSLILNKFKGGTLYNIHVTEEGLVWAGEEGKALTWMDAIAEGKAVTPRMGMPVEINALWYNAIMFSIEMAKLANDHTFISEWKPIADNFPSVFKKTFWSKDKGWLADYVNDNYRDFSIRPNMIFAVSLPYSPLSLKIKQLIIEKVKKELLTSRGLRTLSPTDSNYEGIYVGSQTERDKTYHQGTVWPWLFGHFAGAYLNIYGESGISFIESIYKGFEPALHEAGIGSISEIYDGNPPHLPKGSISQAWSIAEILRTKYLIDQYKSKQ